MASNVAVATHEKEKKEGEPSPQQARSLEEGLAAAEKYEGDPLDCPCIQHMKEGDLFPLFLFICFFYSMEFEYFPLTPF
jgi:hypothetical protein